MWIRGNALAAAALLSFLSAGAGQAQMQNSPMGQSMATHHQMMNQMDMMRRSQMLQSMARAREAQEARRVKQARAECQGSAQGGGGKKCKAASGKSKAPVKNK
jgi:cytochrome c556